MGKERFSGVAVGSIAVGALFVYAGLKAYSIPQALKAMLSGKPPGTGQAPGTLATVDIQSGAAADLATGTAIAGVTVGIPAGVGTGGSYNTAMLQALWQQAGGSAGTARNAACHAMQESGGRSSVTSGNPDGGINVGLWQLDTKGKGAGYTVAQLSDPLTNARITVAATRGGADWSAWPPPDARRHGNDPDCCCGVYRGDGGRRAVVHAGRAAAAPWLTRLARPGPVPRSRSGP